MKAIMVMFDSLNRHMLSPYGCDWIKTPNFERLAKKSVTFRRNYAGSLPCMPARRDLHTGRYNFLHRSWGPLEPFDHSMPEILKKHGIHTHLVSDHYHYWETGGATYHTKYSTWESIRGQEGDPWKGKLKEPEHPKAIGRGGNKTWVARQDWINREYMSVPEKQSQTITFDKGLEFIRTNSSEDSWFLQIETFDPHEPFFTHQKYKNDYPHDYDGPHFDWPEYKPVEQTPDQVKHLRYEYAALVSMCDEQLGRVLDLMDELDLWEDTMLIVNTDHGFLLGEHGWWGKVKPPLYNEVVNTPLFIWDPRSRRQGAACDSLVQMIDIAPTLLEYFDVSIPAEMQGFPLCNAIAAGGEVRDACLFGVHGLHVNCTDGRYVYMRGPSNDELYEYTLMPTHMKEMFSVAELQHIEIAGPSSFTQGCRIMKIKVNHQLPLDKRDYLFDLWKDPGQQHPFEDLEIEESMKGLLVKLMEASDAPEEQYIRLGLEDFTSI